MGTFSDVTIRGFGSLRATPDLSPEGKINRIKFQSSASCWGYFSVGANGNIHEYADSQFGHIFAHGSNREEARKALMMSLKSIDVVGDIRNPVEYLVELAGTEAFKNNTIDTAWLDGIIAQKAVGVKYDRFDVVFYAAVCRAVAQLETRQAELLAFIIMIIILMYTYMYIYIYILYIYI